MVTLLYVTLTCYLLITANLRVFLLRDLTVKWMAIITLTGLVLNTCCHQFTPHCQPCFCFAGTETCCSKLWSGRGSSFSNWLLFRKFPVIKEFDFWLQPASVYTFYIISDCLFSSYKHNVRPKCFFFFLITRCYFACAPHFPVGCDSVVSIAGRYGLDGPGIESLCKPDFPHASRPAVCPSQPPIQGALGLSRE